MDEKLDISKLTKEYEDKAYIATAVSYFEQSEKLDRLMTWVLAFIGGTTALLITNVDKLENLTSSFILKISFSLLLIAGIFGVISKVNANTVQLILGILKTMSQLMNTLIAEYEQKQATLNSGRNAFPKDINSLINMDNVIKRIQSSVPWLLQWVYRDLITKGKEDPLFAIKIGLNMYYKQQMNLILSLGFFLLSLIFLVLNL